MILQIFIGLVTIFATCNIEKATDNQGNPIIPDAEYIKQFIRLVAVFCFLLMVAYNDIIYIDTLYRSSVR